MESALTYQQELVWGIMTKAVEDVNKANDEIESKAIRLGGISSAASSLIGGASMFPAVSEHMDRTDLISIATFCFASLAVIWCVSRLLGPFSYMVIGSEDPDKMCADYIEVEADEAYYRGISELCHVFKHGMFINHAKAKWLTRALWCASIQIALLVISVASKALF